MEQQVQLYCSSIPRRDEEDDDVKNNNNINNGNNQDFDPLTLKDFGTNLATGGTGNADQKRQLLNQMADLYSDDQMARLLMIHTEVQSEVSIEEDEEDDITRTTTTSSSTDSSTSTTSSVFSSLQDIITYNLKESENERTKDIDPSLLLKSKHIRVVASDVDGTLLSTKYQQMHPRTRSAVMKAIESSNILFFPATGKSRAGAYQSLGSDIQEMLDKFKVPGVFLGGLLCLDGNQNILFERKLSSTIVHQVEQLANEMNISIVGYDGDTIYSTEMTDIVKHLSDHYGEPMPQLLRSSSSTPINLADHESCMHKLLLMDEDTTKLTKDVRPKLEEIVKTYGGTVTQALPTMLEVIPDGCSKARGVQAICEAYGFSSDTQLLALGDAENDVSMLRMASIGVAVGNADANARNVADHILTLTCDEGGAGHAIELFTHL